MAVELDGENLTVVMERPDLYPMGVEILPEQSRALVTLGTDDTAVPHPVEVINLRLDGSDAGTFPRLLPEMHALIHGPYDFEAFYSGHSSTSDGEWIAVGGSGGLWGVSADGETAHLLVEEGSNLRLFRKFWLLEDDRTIVFRLGDRVASVGIDGVQPLTYLSPEVSFSIERVISHPETNAIFLLTNVGDGDSVYRVNLDGSGADAYYPLIEPGSSGLEFLGTSPDGAYIIVRPGSGQDGSLYFVSSDVAGDLLPLTPVDDATEIFIDFLINI